MFELDNICLHIIDFQILLLFRIFFFVFYLVYNISKFMIRASKCFIKNDYASVIIFFRIC